jgi:membrane protein DedA with SNARE-associated domain
MRLLLLAMALCLVLFSALPAFAQAEASAPAAADGKPAANTELASSQAGHGFQRALAEVRPLLDRYGYSAVFVAVLAEGVGIPAPGQTLLIASALEASSGRMRIAWVVALVFVAAVLGNSLGYALGRWCGRMALRKLRVNLEREQRLESWFTRRGGLLIVLGRFIEGLRQLNGIVAGVLQMPWWKFTVYNVAGGALWTLAWGLGTYHLGRDIRPIAALFHRHRSWLIILAVAAFAILLVYLLRRQPTRDSETDRGTAGRE